MIKTIYQEIIDLLDQQQSKLISQKIIDYHPYDLAQVFQKLNELQRIKLYAILTNNQIADIFEYLDEELAAEYIKEMDYYQGAKVLNLMEVDDASSILEQLGSDGQKYLRRIPRAEKEELEYLTKHSDNTAGSIMTTNYIEIEANIDVKDAMKYLIKSANDTEVIDPLFIVEKEKLVGILPLKDLIIARSPCLIYTLMDKNVKFVNVQDDINKVTSMINDYDIYALPVLDNNKIVGIITMDDIMDEVVDDFVDDYGKLAGITNDLDQDHNLWKNVIKRIPWLIGLLIISLLTFNITSLFEGVIKDITILVYFQTMILDMAGNVGTQSLAVTVRGISHHYLDSKNNIKKHLLKELKTIIINSLILGVVAFIVSYLFILIKDNNTVVITNTAFIISLAMMITLIITGMLGSLIPIFFYKIKVDPAVASGPLITTLNDVLALVIYLGLASLFMNFIIK